MMEYACDKWSNGLNFISMESKKFEKVLSYLIVPPIYSLSLQIDFINPYLGEFGEVGERHL